MKDAPLPALPEDAAPPRRSATLPQPSPGDRPLPPSTTSRMPQPRPPRAPQPSATMPPPPQPQPRQQNIFRRITSKFRSSNATRQPPVPRPSRDNAAARDAPQRKSTILRMPPMPKAPVPAPPPNDFTSLEQRQAALRARGLIPATSAVPRQFRDGDGFMLPLSEQEAVLDRRSTVVIPGDSSTEDEEGSASEANRIRQAWLTKQFEASSSPSLSEVDKDEDDDRVDAVAAPAADPSPPRKSDAAERASKDGTIGERSPVRVTFVSIDAPPLSPSAAEFGAGAGVASPFDGTEDFHTAPNSPTFPEDKPRLSIEQDGHLRAPSPSSASHPKRLPLTLTTSGVDDVPPRLPTKEQHPLPSDSPSAHSAEKVSRWLRDSSDMPTLVPLTEATAITPAADHESPLSESPRGSLEALLSPSSKAGTVRSRREKPPPIVITQPGKAPSHAAAAPSDSETSTSSSDAQHGRPSVSGSGSTARRLAHAPGIQSRMTGTVPALSPTRTVSSLGAESSLPTPTTMSCGAPALARDASISRGSTSNSSDNGHDSVTRTRRGTGLGLLNTTSKAPGTRATAAIPEEFSETEPSSEGGEFGMNVSPPVPASTRPHPSQEGVAVPRPVRAQTLGQAAEKAQNRKSFSLFGKKSLEMPRETRTSSSMMNLRRAFTSSKPRPKSTLEVTPEVAVGMGRKRSKNFDASRLPPSPTLPTAPTSFAPSSFRGAGRTSNGGLRPPPRQAVAPTMHSHGTIVHQTNFIEDDESRRLSEMAFLT